MKLNSIIFMLTGIALLISGCSFNPTGIDIRGKKMSPDKARPAMRQKASQGLSFFARAEKKDYQLGEPVYMTFRLVNNKTEKYRVLSTLDPAIGSVTITISSKGADDNKQYIPYSEFDYDEGLFTFLEPNQSVSSIVPIFFGANGWTFNEPGLYSIQASYTAANAKGELEVTGAAPVEIMISDAEAGSIPINNAIDSPSWEAGKFLLWQAGDHLLKGQALLDSVLKNNPNSVLAGYIHSAYAHSFSDHFMDYRNRAVRKADCDRARTHLSRVGSGLTDYVLIQNAMSAIRCAAREGNGKQTDKSMRTINQISDGKQEYNEIRQRAAELAKIRDQ